MAVMPPDGRVWGAEPDIVTEAQKLHRLNTDVQFSESRLSREFAERHEHELKYVAAWGWWLSWDSRRWQRERTLKSYELAKNLADDAVEKGGDPKRLLSAKTTAAIESLARSDRRLATTSEIWD